MILEKWEPCSNYSSQDNEMALKNITYDNVTIKSLIVFYGDSKFPSLCYRRCKIKPNI